MTDETKLGTCAKCGRVMPAGDEFPEERICDECAQAVEAYDDED